MPIARFVVRVMLAIVILCVVLVAGARILGSNVYDGEIAYAVTYPTISGYEVYVMGTRSRIEYRVFASQATINSRLLWSPDGSQIAFSASHSNGYDIYVINVNDATIHNLTQGIDNNFSPIWTRDSQHIIFVSAQDSDMEIYSIDVETGTRSNLTRSLSQDFSPALSPDGHQVAFISSKDDSVDINVLDLRTGNLQTIFPNLPYDHVSDLLWIANQLVFVAEPPNLASDFGNTSDVYSINLENGEVQLFFDSQESDEYPILSPDSTMIAINALTQYTADIYLVDTSGLRVATIHYPCSENLNDEAHYGITRSPAWSPDQHFLAIQVVCGHPSEIYLWDSQTGEYIRLTDTRRFEIGPVWRP